jgi:hypothetical protein
MMDMHNAGVPPGVTPDIIARVRLLPVLGCGRLMCV